MWKSLLLSTFNSMFISPVLSFIVAYIVDYEVMFEMSPDKLPSPMLVFCTLLWCALWEDCVFFFTHKLAHTNFFY